MVLSRSVRSKKRPGSDAASAQKYRVSSPNGGGGGGPRSSSRPPSGGRDAAKAAAARRGGSTSSSRGGGGGSGVADDAAAAALAKKLRRIMMGVTAPEEDAARPVPCVEQLVARRFTLSPEGPAHARLVRQAARELGPAAFLAPPPPPGGGAAAPAPLLSSLTPAAAAKAAKSATRAQAEALRAAAAASHLRPDATVPTPAPFSYALQGRRRRRRRGGGGDSDSDSEDDESVESSDTSSASTASGSQGPPPPPPVHPHYAALVRAFGLSEELFRAMPPEQLWAYQRRLYVKKKLRAIRSSGPAASPPSPPPEATEGDGRRSEEDMRQLADMLAAQPQGMGGRAGKRRLPLDFFYLRKHARRRAKERAAAAAATAKAEKGEGEGGEEEDGQQQPPLLDLLTLTPRDPANPSQRLPYSQWDDERYGLAVARKKVLQSVDRARRAGALPAHKYDAAVAAGLLKLRGGNGWLAPTPAAAFAQMSPPPPPPPPMPAAASQQQASETGESSSLLQPQPSAKSVKAAAAASQAKPCAGRGQPPRPGSAPAAPRPPKGRVAAAAAAAASSQQQGCSDDESLSNSADGSDHETPAKKASRGRGNGTRGGVGSGGVGGGGDVGERVACACGHVVRVPVGTAAAAAAAAASAASSVGGDDGGDGALSRTSTAYQLPACRATKVSYAYDNVFLLVGVNKRLYMLAGGRGTAAAATPAATGGGSGGAPTPAVSLWELDVAKDKPARLLPVPAAFRDAQCITAHNERFFVVCGAAYGLCGDGTVWEYNTTSKAARPVHTISSRFPFGSLMCVVLETLHILCGRLGSAHAASLAQAAKGHDVAEGNGKPACGCGSIFSISLETKGHERMLTADAGLLGNAQAMAGVSCNGAAKLYILLGSGGGLCGDGSLIEYDVAQQVRRVVLPPGSLPYGRMLCAVSSTRLVALCGATGHLCDIDLAQSRALLQQSQHRRQQQQQQAPAAASVEPPPPAPAPLPLRVRVVADVETRQAQAMAAVGGRMFAVHGDPAANYDAGLWEYAAPPLPKRAGGGGGGGVGASAPPSSGGGVASASSAAGSEAGSVLCMTFEDYCAAEAAYTKHATERLSLEQLRAASGELLARLKAGTSKQELSVLVERERLRAGPHDLYSLLRVVYHRLPVSEVRRAVAAHEAEKRRRDKDGWGGSWRSQTTPGAAAELERLFAHLGGACDGGGRVVPRVAMETLPATAVLTRADVEDVLGGATGRGLTLDQLAVLFLDTDASAAQEVRPTLFFQSDVPHSSSATASDVLGGKLNKLLETEAFSGVAA